MLKTEVIIRPNVYYDSVSLMQISKSVEAFEGVNRAMVAMGTDMNKELLRAADLLNDTAEGASPSDLVISFLADEEVNLEDVVNLIDEKLNSKQESSKEEVLPPTSIANAVKRNPETNIALISVAGTYAVSEVRKALNKNINVMLFSDNVSIEDEVELKKLAHEKGLLMMGPDCGTAIINNVGLAFANEVRKGTIGIVGASGTGTQEVSVLIDKFGAGVSQVIGTGGRDLSLEVGGIMMLDAIDALVEDPNTQVLVLISKPPHPEIEERIIEKVLSLNKEVVVCFINGTKEGNDGNVHYVSNLEDAASLASELVGSKTNELSKVRIDEVNLNEQQKFVKGLFCGGTLCDEAASIFSNAFPENTYSNVAKAKKLENLNESKEHTFLDMGDDIFTVGKPHPMIEPSLRNQRLITEALKDETAVVLFDVELGYGSHQDPAGEVVQAIKEAKERLNQNVVFIAYVLGTENDPQGYYDQVHKLEDAGVTVASSNARAAKLALEIVGGLQ